MASTFTKIAEIATNTSGTTYTFSSIPQTYSHLIMFGHIPVNSASDSVNATITGQTSNYSAETSNIAYSASLPTSGSSATNASIRISNNANSHTDGIVIFKVDFQNYSNASMKPSFLSIASSTASSNATTTNPTLITATGAGNTASAVSSITLTLGAIARNTSGIISLYGVV